MMEEQRALSELYSKCTSTEPKLMRNLGEVILELQALLSDKLEGRGFSEEDRLEGVRFTESLRTLASISKEIFAEDMEISMRKFIAEIEATTVKRAKLWKSQDNANSMETTAANTTNSPNDSFEIDECSPYFAIRNEVPEVGEDTVEDISVLLKHRDGLPYGCTKADLNPQSLEVELKAEAQSNSDDTENNIAVNDHPNSRLLSEDGSEVNAISGDGDGMYNNDILSGNEPARVSQIDEISNT